MPERMLILFRPLFFWEFQFDCLRFFASIDELLLDAMHADVEIEFMLSLASNEHNRNKLLWHDQQTHNNVAGVTCFKRLIFDSPDIEIMLSETSRSGPSTDARLIFRNSVVRVIRRTIEALVKGMRHEKIMLSH